MGNKLVEDLGTGASIVGVIDGGNREYAKFPESDQFPGAYGKRSPL
jgi:hypothetical protein